MFQFAVPVAFVDEDNGGHFQEGLGFDEMEGNVDGARDSEFFKGLFCAHVDECDPLTVFEFLHEGRGGDEKGRIALFGFLGNLGGGFGGVF